MKTVTEIIESLRLEGYIHDFSVKDDLLFCNANEGRGYSPGELVIDKTERYEGDSNPSDNEIIYAITASDGIRGVVSDSYGVYSDPILAKIIGDIPLNNESA